MRGRPSLTEPSGGCSFRTVASDDRLPAVTKHLAPSTASDYVPHNTHPAACLWPHAQKLCRGSTFQCGVWPSNERRHFGIRTCTESKQAYR